MASEVRFGAFRYDSEGEVLYRKDELVGLAPREAALLGCLLAAAGELVSKDHLLATVWPDSYVSDDSLSNAISGLRRALGDNARAPRFIATVTKKGYRFVAPVVVGPPAGPRVDLADASPARVLPERGSRIGPAVVLAAVLIFLGVGFVVMGNLGDPPGAGTLERIHRIGLTVAVEPGTARQAAAAPLAASELPDAAVTRAALAEAIERETRLTVVAEDMPHEALLSVVLTAAADRLHVGARVRGSADGANWWGQDWDLPVALYADADFTRSLLARLRFLLDLTSAYSTIRGTTNRDAMLLAVQASDLLLGPAQQDLRRAQEGADALRRALALDPDFARARAGGVAIRAEAAGWRPWTEEEIAAAGLDLDTALAGDPEDPIIHIARALMALLQEDLPQMGRALDEAETYGPSFFWTYLIRADFELQLGFGDMALASALRAVELDPYMLPSWGRVVDVQLWRGDLDGADQALARMVALDVDGFWAGRSRAHILLARGDLDAAESELLALRERWANALWVHQELAAIYLALGDAAAAQAATARLEALLRE